MSKFLNVLKVAAEKRIQSDLQWARSTWARLERESDERRRARAASEALGGGRGKWRGCPA
jgi:hypothetical protein